MSGVETGGSPAVTETTAAPAETHVDVDALELEAARQAVEAEEAARTGGEGGQPQPQATPPAGGQGGQPAARVPEAMIPKARFDEVNARAREAQARSEQMAAENARLNEALAAARGPVIPADQQIAAIDAKLDEIAAQYDAGSIGFADMQKQQRELNRQIDGIRDAERQAAQVSQAPEPAKPTRSLALENETATLEEKYPYTMHLTNNQLTRLKGLAEDELANEGFAFDGSERATLALRQRVAELSEIHGPRMLQGNDPVATARAAGGGAPQRTLSPNAQARQDKLNLSEGMPAAIDGMTRGGGGTGELTEEAIMSMTAEELEALPRATRQRLMGT